MKRKVISDAVLWLPGFAPNEDPIVVLGSSFEAMQAAPAEVEDLLDDELSFTGSPTVPMLKRSIQTVSPWGRVELGYLDAYSTAVEKYKANLAALDVLEALGSGSELDANARAALNRYTGWGGLPMAFNTQQSDASWAWRSSELEARLTESQYESAKGSTLNAHYTPQAVINWMWDAVKKMGFTGGKVIEPCAGTGFFLANMPEDLQEASQVTAVEPDELSFGILKALYEQNGVMLANSGFESFRTPGGYDLAITNVPFGDYQVFEKRNVPYQNYNIHDYMIGKCLDVVRDGGLVAVITSTGSMDKHGEVSRSFFESQADLVGAFRLPNGIFRDVAGTEAAACALFFRKGKHGLGKPKQWTEVSYCGRRSVYLNPLWENAANVIGTLSVVRGRYSAHELHGVMPADLQASLADALQQIPADIYQAAAVRSEKVERASRKLQLDGEQRLGFFIRDGVIYESLGSEAVEVMVTGKQAERLSLLVAIRDAARKLINVQLSAADDEALKPYQVALNVSYDKFVKAFGFINLAVNRRAFQRDLDLPLLLSLELWDEGRKKAAKADIFTKRTIRKFERVERVDSLEEALTVSVSELCRVDEERIAGLVGKSPVDAMAELEDKGLVFLDPEADEWEIAALYLSGDVRKKLVAAEAAGARFKRNVDALAKVLPEPLLPCDITVKIGATWVPSKYYAEFLNHIFDSTRFEVNYCPKAGAWHLTGDLFQGRSTKGTQVYGTSRINGVELFELCLNQRHAEVKDKVDDKYVPNKLETVAAREKQEKLQAEFVEWVWSDERRRVVLCDIYNERFNSIVRPVYDGSHLKLPGYTWAHQPHSHQLNAVWRGLVSKKNLLLGHVVGAGKTLTMILLGMEMRRLGRASKNLYVCPGHMLEQFTAEFLRAYPSAKVLMATKDDLAGDRRRTMLSRIATSDLDAVVITHSSFEKLAVSPEYMRRFIEEEVRQIEWAIQQQGYGTARNNAIVKELAKAKKQWSVKLLKLGDDSRKDNVLYFEDLGIDQLFYDEAHYGKNLAKFTKMNRVAGLSTNGSERAFDLFVKTRHIMEQRGSDAGVVFATGTHIANSVAEQWVMQKYLQPSRLEELQIDMFDSWAANFGAVVSSIELAPEGSGYRSRDRFARFVNVPELMDIFSEVADIQTAEMLKLPTPRAIRETVVTEATAHQKAFVKELAKRAEMIRNGQVKVSTDNMLSVTNDGRLAAVDMRLIGHSGEREGAGAKIQSCAEKVYSHWLASVETLGTQLVFCDTGTPSGNARLDVYSDLKRKLMAMGIPDEQIAFIHSYDSDAAKEKLYSMVREGHVRVLVGSTTKCGVGTNVQKRLIALHHLDAPWRPADVQQREGRIERVGNTNSLVYIYRYVTSGTFDSYIWQTLETKMRFIAQVLRGDAGLRKVEDVELAALSYAEVKALASGNPLVLEKAGVDADLAKLSLIRTAWQQSQWRNRGDLNSLPQQINAERVLVSKLQKDAQAFATSKDATFVTAHQKKLTNPDVIGNYIVKCSRGIVAGMSVDIGLYHGFQISIFGHNDADRRKLVLRRNAQLSEILPQNGAQAFELLGRMLESIPSLIKGRESRIARFEVDLIQAQELVDLPFEHEARYQELVKRQEELVDLLDLAKSDQAAVDDAATDQSEAA